MAGKSRSAGSVHRTEKGKPNLQADQISEKGSEGKQMGKQTDCLVLRGVGGNYEMQSEQDGRRIFCRARGALRRDDGIVLVGDRVTVEEDGMGAEVIASVKPRRNRLIRPPLANLDGFLVVAAVRDPAPILDTVDKLLVILTHNRIPATVVITKADLDGTGAESLAELYRRAGYAAYALSAQTGEGLEALRAEVSGRLQGGGILALGGASGVGKSSLLNALYPALGLDTGALSRKTARGKNTTRACALFPLDGGYIADTPGFSLLDFLRFDFLSCGDLADAFPEIAARLGGCRYGDCRHIREEECAIRRAVAAGEIAQSRYACYCNLYELLRQKERSANGASPSARNLV